MFDNDALSQAASRIDRDTIASVVLAMILAPFGYFSLLLIEEWVVMTLCRELVRC